MLGHGRARARHHLSLRSTMAAQHTCLARQNEGDGPLVPPRLLLRAPRVRVVRIGCPRVALLGTRSFAWRRGSARQSRRGACVMR